MNRRLFNALDEVGTRVACAPHVLLCLDFDGTLTPIVDHPDQVALPPATRQVLEALAGQKDVSVAVISGRDRADPQARVGVPGLIYAGNHGLEISGPGFFFVEPTAVIRCEALKELAVDLATRLAAIAGTLVEDKGLTLSMHYRQVAEADWEEVRRLIHATLAHTSHPFVLTTGDKVYEVKPRVDWNKGTAVGWIQEQIGKPNALVFYLGDDATDEDGFQAVQNGITVKIGNSSETAAHYRMQGPLEFLKLLQWLVKRVRGIRGHRPVRAKPEELKPISVDNSFWYKDAIFNEVYLRGFQSPYWADDKMRFFFHLCC